MANTWQIVVNDGVATCRRGDEQFEVTVEWGVVGGRPEPTGVTVSIASTEPSRSPEFLTATSIRLLPIGHAVAALRDAGDPARFARARADAHESEWLEFEGLQYQGAVVGDGSQELHEKMMESKEAADRYQSILDVAKGPQRGRTRGATDHQAVADVYLAAYRDNHPVTRAVADAFQVSPSTAGKRIMAARRAGLLDGLGRTR
jgi:hypothetical protein